MVLPRDRVMFILAIHLRYINNLSPSIEFVYIANDFLSLQFAPFILTLTLFPRREFERAIRLQTIFNKLMHWVAHDSEFLRETLTNTIKVDPYIRNLFNIFDRIEREGGPNQVIRQKNNYCCYTVNNIVASQ